MIRKLMICTAAFSAGLFMLGGSPAQDPPAAEPEVLTRGPVHEAFASAVTGEAKPAPIVEKAPPDPIEELPPDEKPEGENVQWLPGYWAFDEERNDYLWVSGFWRVPPPGRQWVPGAWRPEAGGHQWTSGFWAPSNVEQVEYVPPPPAPLQAPPSTPAPGPDYTYVPGNWVYRETRYAWQPGVWVAYRPGWVYIPAHYSWSPCGYVFVPGYWDYPLRQRGVLFAPVYFNPAVYRRPAFAYRPAFVVYDDALYGALFVRPGYSAYYFGDYFEARYTSRGYRSWIDVRIGVGGYDPLWGYYRHAYAGNPGWSVGITALYAGRYRGDVPRPPRTYAQQNLYVNNSRNNTTVNNTTVINNVKNVTMIAPVGKVDKSVVNLKPVTAVEKQQALAAVKQTRAASVQRVKLESAAIQPAVVGGKAQPKGPPRPMQIQLPKSATVANTPANAAPPPPLPPPLRPNVPANKSGPSPITPVPKNNPPQVKDAPKGNTPPPLPKKDAPKVDAPKGNMPPPLPKKDAPKVDAPKANTPPPLPKNNPNPPPMQKNNPPLPPVPPIQKKAPPIPPQKTPPPPPQKDAPKSGQKDGNKGGPPNTLSNNPPPIPRNNPVPPPPPMQKNNPPPIAPTPPPNSPKGSTPPPNKGKSGPGQNTKGEKKGRDDRKG